MNEALNLRESVVDVDKVLTSWEGELRKFWKIPENPNFIHVDPDRKFISFSGSIYRFPLIVDISKADRSPRLYYEDIDAPLSEVITNLSSDTRSLWVDFCDRVSSIYDMSNADDPDHVCIWDDGPVVH